MKAEALAATMTGPGQIEIVAFPIPDQLEPGAVLLEMEASGICGTDKHTFRGEIDQYAGTANARSTPFPIIPGHENVARVAAIGKAGATTADGAPLAVGDRVVPAPNWSCGICRFCAEGYPYYLCRRLENYGNSLSCAEPPHLFGGWAEYLYVLTGTKIFRIPDEIPTEVAVLTEILAVAHGLELAARAPRPGGFRPGDTVVVVGVGPVGLMHVLKAELMGAGRIVALDLYTERLEIATALGASETVVAGGGDAVSRVMEMTSGRGADVAVDATGDPKSLPVAIDVVRDGGTVLEVGSFVDVGSIDLNPAVLVGRNLSIIGVGGEDARAYDGAIRLLVEHHERLGVGRVVTHVFPIEQAAEAMEVAQAAGPAVKVVIAGRAT